VGGTKLKCTMFRPAETPEGEAEGPRLRNLADCVIGMQGDPKAISKGDAIRGFCLADLLFSFYLTIIWCRDKLTS
jgi:hypothetical protein